MSENSVSPNSCPKCGIVLPSAATAGLCPRCLMAEAMEATQTEAEPATLRKTLSPEELAPHFPQLEILECLGRGGMGVVYKARQKTLNRVVALKLLAPERVADAGFAERFTREAQALAALNHPSIVTIYDFGTTTPPRTPDAIPHPPFFFLLMEFVDGVNLRQAMKAGRFTPEQALAVVPPVCEALQYAHEHGIVHRDIKPENLLLDKDGRVKIADFGIAKMLHADGSDVGLAESQPVGTPQYMAPEQKEHRRTDHRADIYSLGVVLYELLTGEMPADKLQPPSRRVQIDVRLDEIVLRALEQKPELRFQTAGEMRTQVETFERADREERIEKSKQPPALSPIISPLSSPPPPPARFLKVGTSTLTTPAQLATVSGQLFHYRTRGQLVLDDRQLTHSAPPAMASPITIIPLAAIRDVSIGKYPRSMNPLGIDLLSVTYEEDGQRKQVLLSPMEGYFAMPSTWDARVAEWATAIREAVTAATGRAPSTTPSEKLGVPGSHVALLTMFLMPLLPLGVFVACLTVLTSPGVPRHNISLVSMFAIGIAAFGFFLLFTKRRWMKSPTGSAPSLGSRLIGAGLLLAGVVLAGLLFFEESRAHNARFLMLTGEIPKLQQQWSAAQTEAFQARTALSRFEVNAINARTDAEKRSNEIVRRRLTNEVTQATLRADAAQQQIPAATDAINQLSFPTLATLRGLWLPGLFVLAGLWLLFRRHAWQAGGASAGHPFRNVVLLLVLPVALLGFLLLNFAGPVHSPSGVTRFDLAPVGVSNNVVIVDVTTEVGRGNAELRAVLDGPQLSATTEAGLADTFFPPFAGTFIKPTPHTGNQPFRILPTGRQTWRLGFVLPDAALAQEALANLRPIGHLPAEAQRTFVGTLFEVSQPGGAEYRASLSVALPVTAADPSWVSVSSTASYNESGVRMNWELFASQPGTVRFSRGSGRSSTPLKPDAKSKLHRIPIQLELTKVGPNRVLLVTEMGGIKSREEFPGNFRDLSAELIRYVNLTAKTVCGASIELCQFQGKSFTVQVDGAVPTPSAARAGTSRWSFPGKPNTVLAVVVVGGLVLAGIVLLVVLVRKGGTAGKTVLLLGGMLLLVAGLAIAGLLGLWVVRGASSIAAPAITFTNVQHTVMGMSNTVLFTELDFHVEGNEPVELRVEFTGPALPQAIADGLPRETADNGRLFASLRTREHNAVLLQPAPTAGQEPRVHFKPGPHKWQIGFALPNEKLTWQARGNFRAPITRLAPGRNGEQAWQFFAVGSDNNANYSARLVARRNPSTHGGTGATDVPASGVTYFRFGLIAVGAIVFGFGGVALLVWLLRKGGASNRVVLLVLAVPLLLGVIAIVVVVGMVGISRDFGPGVSLTRLAKSGQMVLEPNYPASAQSYPPGQVQQTQNGFRLQLPAAQLASFEFFIRQADDSWQPVPSLTALVATGQDGGYHDSLHWTLRRSGARETTNQLWFWTVSANANGGRALPQLTDHGTNFTHSVMPGDTLDWWQLSTPVQTVLKPGEQQIIPLFRTHGTATARGNLPKEAFLRVRCEPLPAGLNVASNSQFVEAGLAAHALLAKALPASNAATAIPQHIEFKVLRVENPPGTRDILLHFERDKNPGLGLEVTQDVTPSPGLRKQPEPGTYRDWQVKTWAGVNDRVLGWTLPQEFTAAEVRAVAKDMEQRAKSLRQLPDGAVPEFATAVHRDGWKYHLFARVLRAPVSVHAGPAVPTSAPTFETVSGEASALLAKFFPNAVQATTTNEFTAQHATQEFEIHTQFKTGEVAQKAVKQTGPSATGFMLAVQRLKAPLVSAAADLPQSFDRPYWKSYVNRSFDPQTSQGVAVYFDFGARLHPEFKAAMLELLKLGGSGPAVAPLIRREVK